MNPERPSVPPGPGYEEMADEQLKYLRSAAVDAVDNESLLDDISEYDFPEGMDIKDIVGVKLQSSGPVILFDCQNMYLDAGDKVIVETGRGLVLGQVVVPAKRQMLGRGTLQRVIRKASANDLRQREKNKDKEDAAFRLCKDRIERLRLPMKLIKVEYLHGGNKAVFYFSSEGRVDFRELVRDLAKRLHTRIEMRQVGVRDESRMLGGIGVCGLRLCCNTFLRDFQPVSIRMAKDQNLVLNPQKVSGVCGRLLCCLVYEDEAYRSASRGMPRVGRRVLTPEGEGRVRDRDVLKRVLRVQLQDETNLREYRVDDIRPASSQNQQNADQTTDEDKPDTALAEILEDDTESFSTP